LLQELNDSSKEAMDVGISAIAAKNGDSAQAASYRDRALDPWPVALQGLALCAIGFDESMTLRGCMDEGRKRRRLMNTTAFTLRVRLRRIYLARLCSGHFASLSPFYSGCLVTQRTLVRGYLHFVCQRPPALPFGLHCVQAISILSVRFASARLRTSALPAVETGRNARSPFEDLRR
jgi:hypothetical protein